MKAGEIEINILANYERMEQDLRQVERRSIEAGRRAGSGFKDEFASKSQAQAEAIFGKFTGLKAAESLANGVANFLRSDKSIPEALADSIKGIPWAGTFYNLGEAIFETIYENTVGAADAAARSQARLAEVAWAEDQERAEKANAEEKARQEEKVRTIAALEKQLAEQNERSAIALAELSPDRMKAINAREVAQRAALEREFDQKLAAAKSEDEKKLLRSIRSEKEQELNFAFIREKDQLERGRREEREAAKRDAEKAAKEQAENEAKERERLAEEEFKRQMERNEQLAELSERAAQIEEERIASQIAGLTEGQTAAGAFRFDAYPDAMKRKNDETQIQKLEAIRAEIAQKAGFT